MTKFLPPPDREGFEREIDSIFEKFYGSKDAFARFLGVNPATVSKRLNPYNGDHVSSFYQVIRDIAALRLVDLDLAKMVWTKVRLEIEKILFDELIGFTDVGETISQIHETLGKLSRAQWDRQPLSTLIARSADLETEAKVVKEKFIAMRNENYMGTGDDKKDIN